MNSHHCYNKVRHYGPFVLQIRQGKPHSGLSLDLLPQICLAICNGQLHVGLGFDWLHGSVSFGIMTKRFREREERRLSYNVEQAAKWDITLRQQELRYSEW